MTAINAVIIATGSLGLLFMLISLIGIIRFPDFYARLHAQGIGDTLGALLVIISMMAAAGSGLMSTKIFLVFVIILLTNPLGTNLMMNAGMSNKEYREYKTGKPGRKRKKTSNEIVEEMAEEIIEKDTGESKPEDFPEVGD